MGNLELVLPPTANNIAGAPNQADQLRITFYYSTTNDKENLYFTRNGIVYGNKNFAIIDKVYVSSGFSNSSTGKLVFSVMNQPVAGSRYRTFYDYLAPKPNERIAINYNYNQLIVNSTVALEPNRPITADVLIKQATQLLVNFSVAIVVASIYVNSTSVVLQNVQNAITNAINTNKLGGVIYASDLSSVAQAVTGVARVRVVGFNFNGVVGQVLNLTAQSNQYFSANTITVVAESI